MMRSSCTFVREPTTADVRTCADTVREEEIVAIHSLDLLRGRRGDHGQLGRNLGREQAVNVYTIETQNYNTVNTNRNTNNNNNRNMGIYYCSLPQQFQSLVVGGCQLFSSSSLPQIQSSSAGPRTQTLTPGVTIIMVI